MLVANSVAEVAGLYEPVGTLDMFVGSHVLSCIDHLEFICLVEAKRGVALEIELGREGNPVEPLGKQDGSVGFYRDSFAFPVQSIDHLVGNE